MVRSEISDFAEEVVNIMQVVSREFLKQQHKEIFRAKMTFPQSVVLGLLEKHGELKMSDMAKDMSISSPAITGIVERLVRDGYVARGNELGDRRIIKISLTKKGEEAVKYILKRKRDVITRVFSTLSRAEREDYLRILRRVQEELDKKNKGKKDEK
ncbi:MAG TPA: MarR family transcriptional regulator [Candidatus Omnitrophota bacterium]|nr:MarR family transcriptional regulator [Candidatus Omnitrophota bacterium]HPS20764.1 MarR family transcriptional regulator [Candidatus Omnitrophota bacterium]